MREHASIKIAMEVPLTYARVQRLLTALWYVDELDPAIMCLPASEHVSYMVDKFIKELRDRPPPFFIGGNAELSRAMSDGEAFINMTTGTAIRIIYGVWVPWEWFTFSDNAATYLVEVDTHEHFRNYQSPIAARERAVVSD